MPKPISSVSPRAGSNARRQDRFNPIQKIIGAGCNTNRKIDDLIENAGFEIITLDRFLLPNAPRILAEMYLGVAKSE